MHGVGVEALKGNAQPAFQGGNENVHHAGAALEGGAGDGFKRVGQGDVRQTRAGVEGEVANAGHALGNYDFAELGAEVERLGADGGEAVGQGDAGDGLEHGEGFGANRRYGQPADLRRNDQLSVRAGVAGNGGGAVAVIGVGIFRHIAQILQRGYGACIANAVGGIHQHLFPVEPAAPDAVAIIGGEEQLGRAAFQRHAVHAVHRGIVQVGIAGGNGIVAGGIADAAGLGGNAVGVHAGGAVIRHIPGIDGAGVVGGVERGVVHHIVHHGDGGVHAGPEEGVVLRAGGFLGAGPAGVLVGLHAGVAEQEVLMAGAQGHVGGGIVPGRVEVVPAAIDLDHVPAVVHALAGHGFALNIQHVHHGLEALQISLAHAGAQAEHFFSRVDVQGGIVLVGGAQIIVHQHNLAKRGIRLGGIGHDLLHGGVEGRRLAGDLRFGVEIFHLNVGYVAVRGHPVRPFRGRVKQLRMLVEHVGVRLLHGIGRELILRNAEFGRARLELRNQIVLKGFAAQHDDVHRLLHGQASIAQQFRARGVDLFRRGLGRRCKQAHQQRRNHGDTKQRTFGKGFHKATFLSL